MREERTIHLVEIPIGGKEGLVWNRLHAEREERCEAFVKEETEGKRHILEARLRRIDDALDRLMSGSYGNCSQCGNAIDKAKLEIDPAVALCRNCRTATAAFAEDESNIDDVAMESLSPFDTILLRTYNSDDGVAASLENTSAALH